MSYKRRSSEICIGLFWLGLTLGAAPAVRADTYDNMVDKLSCTSAPFYELDDDRWQFNAQWRMLDYITRIFYQDGKREAYEVVTFSSRQIYVRSAHWIISVAGQWQGERATVAVYNRRTATQSVLWVYFTCHCDDYYQGYVDHCRSHL